GDPDAEFNALWRAELLRRAWSALEAYQQESRRPLHTVLRFKADHPRLSSTELAEHLGERLGKAITSAALRQTLHPAREKSAELWPEEVRQSLPGASADRVEQELLDLGLFRYCRPNPDHGGPAGA